MFETLSDRLNETFGRLGKKGRLTEKDVDDAMREVHSRVYAGFVFISLAQEPEPFDEFIAPLRQFLDDSVIGEMRHIWWKRAAMRNGCGTWTRSSDGPNAWP